jgi:hypothetical protein
MSCSGNKQLFEITIGEKSFFIEFACFMLLREIAEAAFFRGA